MTRRSLLALSLIAITLYLFFGGFDYIRTRLLTRLSRAFDQDLAVGMATGTVLLHPDKPPSMFINEIGTRDAYLRQGIGSRVTRALIDIARDRGCKGIWLGTETDNHAALGLYRSLKAEELAGVFFGWDDAL